jgi:hypothetical protein
MSKVVRRLALALVAIGGLSLAALALLSAGDRSGSPAAVTSAKSVFERAMVLSQRAAVPVRQPGHRQSARMRQDTRAAATRALATAFAGQALTHETRALDNALTQEADPSFLVLGGGSDHFVYHSVEAASSARILLTATVRTWSRIAQVRPTDGKTVVATPSNAIDVRAVVEKGADGAWRVTSYTWTFQPGSEP